MIIKINGYDSLNLLEYNGKYRLEQANGYRSFVIVDGRNIIFTSQQSM